MKKNRTPARDEAREDELVALAKTMSNQQRLEAAVRLSALAFQFHQAGIVYREGLRAGGSGKDDAAGEDKHEA